MLPKAKPARRASPAPTKSVTDVNRLLYSDDCLNVLNDELALPTGSVDLIYLDPPFNSKNHYNLPFKGKDKDTRPVEAFNDTWTWGSKEDDLLRELAGGPQSRYLADIVNLAQAMERGRRRRFSLAAYLLNMAARLLPMRRVLASTGSIYLHCDPTASHYLKLMMDAIFGYDNLCNEIIWHYRKWSTGKYAFQKNHDVILFYARLPSRDRTFNQLYMERAASTLKRFGTSRIVSGYDENGRRIPSQVADEESQGVRQDDVWEIGRVPPIKQLFPTEKPVALLERIIAASSNPGDLVLDPFCGCGTAVHAAEKLGRRWVGVDISAFAVGLMRERILGNFKQLTTDDVLVRGVPVSVTEAEALASRDKFEFEKWVCGAIGAEGMFHEPGTRGADGGVDGVLRFYPFHLGKKPTPEFAIIQVKGGNVTADSVKALQATVERFDATAGVMVCFDRYMRTVENQRSKRTFSDDSDTYPVIQGLSVENLLAGQPLDLPLYGRRRVGGRIGEQSELLATRN